MDALLLSEVFPPQTGGSGRWLYELYRRMPGGCAAVVAGEYSGSEDFDSEQTLEIERLPLHFRKWGLLDRQALGQYLWTASRVRKLTQKHQVQVVHCGRTLPEGWMAWMLRLRTGMPYWIYVHGEELEYGLKSRQLGWMMRRVYAGATGVIANSENTTSMLRRDWKVPEGKLHTLNPGVDAQRFCPVPRDHVVRQRLGWGERPVVLTVGRLQKRKGQDMLIRAMSAIRDRVPDVLYSIVGDGQERAALQTLIDEHRLSANVELRGEPSDVGSSRVDLQACKLEYSIVSPK